MKRALAAAAFVVLMSGTALGGDGIKIKAGGSSVQVGPGGVKVKVPGMHVEADEEGSSVQSGGSVGAAGGAVTYSGTEKSFSHTCDDKHGRSVVVDGVENTVTLKGKCDSVAVNGTSNKVTMETVGRITVSGVENVLKYKSGFDGKTPSISKTGVDNTVTRIKD